MVVRFSGFQHEDKTQGKGSTGGMIGKGWGRVDRNPMEEAVHRAQSSDQRRDTAHLG